MKFHLWKRAIIGAFLAGATVTPALGIIEERLAWRCEPRVSLF